MVYYQGRQASLIIIGEHGVLPGSLIYWGSACWNNSSVPVDFTVSINECLARDGKDTGTARVSAVKGSG